MSVLTHDKPYRADGVTLVPLKTVVEREIAAVGEFGPFHRIWLLGRAPERVRRNLELAKKYPHLLNVGQTFDASMNGLQGVATASFAAINTSASELNMLGATQAILDRFCTIPPTYCYAGQEFNLKMSGNYGNTGTPTVVFTPRWGNSTTPGTNISLGPNSAYTTITGTTGLGYLIEFDFEVRTSPPGATQGTGIGRGRVSLGIPVTNTQVVADILIGGTAATIDTSGFGAAPPGLTMNLTWSASSASNTQTCERFNIRSKQ